MTATGKEGPSCRATLAVQDDKQVTFSQEAVQAPEGKAQRAKDKRYETILRAGVLSKCLISSSFLQDRKGTGFVKPEMFKDLVDEDRPRLFFHVRTLLDNAIVPWTA